MTTSDLGERCVLGVVVFVHGVVAGSVVGTQEGPAAVSAVVGARRVQQVAVEEQRVA